MKVLIINNEQKTTNITTNVVYVEAILIIDYVKNIICNLNWNYLEINNTITWQSYKSFWMKIGFFIKLFYFWERVLFATKWTVAAHKFILYETMWFTENIFISHFLVQVNFWMGQVAEEIWFNFLWAEGVGMKLNSYFIFMVVQITCIIYYQFFITI